MFDHEDDFKLTEFYLDDYLMQTFALPTLGGREIGLIGDLDDFGPLEAWYCCG